MDINITWGLEGAAVEFGIFKYKSWKLAYSGPIYLCVCWINMKVLRRMRFYRDEWHADAVTARSNAAAGHAGSRTADSQAAAWKRRRNG